MKILKILLLTVLLLILLAAAIIGIFIWTFDLNRYKNIAETKLTEMLKHPVQIESMSTQLSFIPTISIAGFKILNNEPFQSEKPLLEVQKMSAELELIPLINSQINIHRISIDTANLNLIQENETNNWEIKASETNKNQKTVTSSDKKIKSDNIRLQLIDIKTLNAAYTKDKKTQELVVNKLQLKQLHVLSGDFIYGKQTVNVNLNTSPVFEFLDMTNTFPVDLKISSKLFNISINGKITNLKQLANLQAVISVSSTNLKNTLDFFKISHPMIPAQSGQLTLQFNGNQKKLDIKQANFDINAQKDFTVTGSGTLTSVLKDPTLTLKTNIQLSDSKTSKLWKISPLTLKGDVVVTPTSIKASKMSVEAKRSDVQFSGSFSWAKAPYDLQLEMTSDYLDYHDFVLAEQSESTTAKSEPKKAQQETSLPWDILNKLTANADIQIKHLQTTSLLSGLFSLSTKPALKKGVLQAPFEIKLLDGSLTGALTANASSQQIETAVIANRLNLDGIRPIAQQIQNLVLNSKIELTSKGATKNTLLKNLKGRVIAQTQQGRILNPWFINLAKALTAYRKRKGSSVTSSDEKITITCAAANLTINQGIISGKEQIAMETNALNIVAGGTINLVEQTLNINAYPSLPFEGKLDEVLSISKLIRITGPFNKPTPKVDTVQAAASLIEKGLNKLINTSTTNALSANRGQLCQNILGTATSTQTKTVNKTEVTKKQTTTTKPKQKKSANEEFKQQLANSLLQALSSE